MAMSDCSECWQTPCECGHEYKKYSPVAKEVLTKAINVFTINEVFDWIYTLKNVSTSDITLDEFLKYKNNE